jgi:hypothetical protein
MRTTTVSLCTLLAVSVSGVSAVYGTDLTFHGNLCTLTRPPGRTVTNPAFGRFGATNVSRNNANLQVSCGLVIPADEILNRVVVVVYDRNDRRDVSCRLLVSALNGFGLVANEVKTTSGANIPEMELDFLVGGGETGTLECTIPPPDDLGLSHLTSYRIETSEPPMRGRPPVQPQL